MTMIIVSNVSKWLLISFNANMLVIAFAYNSHSLL